MSEWKEAIKLAVSLCMLTLAVSLVFNIVDLTMLYANNVNESIAKTIGTTNLDDYDGKIVDRNTARNIARRYYFDIRVDYYSHTLQGTSDIKNKISDRGDYKLEVLKDGNDVKYLRIERN